MPAELAGAAVDRTSLADPALRTALSRLHDCLIDHPEQLVLGLRIDTARALLLHGARPAEVALRAGSYDQAHFTRHFKKHTSTTPARFARSHPAAPMVPMPSDNRDCYFS